MFEGIQKNLLELNHFHDLCHKYFLNQYQYTQTHSSHSITPNDQHSIFLQQILPYFPSIRGKLEETLQQTKLLCETNIHCLAKITILQQEKSELSQAYEVRIKHLETEIESLRHALDHQKTLSVNYNHFANLHSYWKEILHHVTLSTNISSSPSTLNNPSSLSRRGNKSSPSGAEREDKPSTPSTTSVATTKTSTPVNTSLLQASLLHSSLDKRQILEMEEICAKLLNWLSIDSYQAIQPYSTTSSSSIHHSSLNLSMSIMDSHHHNPSSFLDTSYKEWTQAMIQRVKRVKDYVYHLISTVQSDQREREDLHQQLKEQKQQKHRLYEKLLETNLHNERLQMQSEEFRTTANNYHRKIYGNEKQLRQLFDLLLQQKLDIQTTSTSNPPSAPPSRPASRLPSPTHAQVRVHHHSHHQSLNRSSGGVMMRSSSSPAMVNTQPITVPLASNTSLSHQLRSRTPSPQRITMIPNSITPPHYNPTLQHQQHHIQLSQQHPQPKPLQLTPPLLPPPRYSRIDEKEERAAEEAETEAEAAEIRSSLDSLEYNPHTYVDIRPYHTPHTTNPHPIHHQSSSNAPSNQLQQLMDHSLTYSFSSVEEEQHQQLHQQGHQARAIGSLRGRAGPPPPLLQSSTSHEILDLTFPSTISLTTTHSHSHSNQSSVPPSSNSSLHSQSHRSQQPQLPLLPEEIQVRREQQHRTIGGGGGAVRSTYHDFISPVLTLGSTSTSSHPDEMITLEKLAQF